MARFVHPVHMRWSDMDAYRHINNSAYLAVPRAKPALRCSSTATRASPASTVIARHEIDYLRPVIYHPEPLRLELWIGKVRGASFIVHYEVSSTVTRWPRALRRRTASPSTSGSIDRAGSPTKSAIIAGFFIRRHDDMTWLHHDGPTIAPESVRGNELEALVTTHRLAGAPLPSSPRCCGRAADLDPGSVCAPPDPRARRTDDHNCEFFVRGCGPSKCARPSRDGSRLRPGASASIGPCSARELLGWLDGERDRGTGRPCATANWRGRATRRSRVGGGWTRCRTRSSAISFSSGRCRAQAGRGARRAERVPGAQPRSEVASRRVARLGRRHPHDGRHRRGFRRVPTSRCARLSALTRMGFLARGSHAARRRQRSLDPRSPAAYGSVYAERAGFGLGLL